MQKTGIFIKVSAWLFNHALCIIGLNTFLSIYVVIIPGLMHVNTSMNNALYIHSFAKFKHRVVIAMHIIL